MYKHKKKLLITGLVLLIFLLGNGVITQAAQTNSASTEEKNSGSIKSPFKDITSTDPNLIFITYINQKGIMKGFPDGTYHPAEGLTRAQAAVVIVKAAGIKTSDAKEAVFKDLPSTHWAAAQVAAAVEAGYIKGFPDGTYKPDEKLTRAQGISLIMRLCTQKERAVLPTLQDMDNQHWAAGDMGTALALDMIGLSVDKKMIYPDAQMSRGSLARALAILLTKDPGLNQAGLTGTLTEIKGEATLNRNNKTETLKNDTVIYEGDIVKTGKSSQARLVYPDGSGTLIEENTEVVIKKSDGRSYIKQDGSPGVAVEYLNIDLKQGTLFGALATKRVEDQEEATSTDKKQTKLNDRFASQKAFIQLAADEKAQPWYKTAEKKKVRMKVDMPWGVAAVRGTFIKVSVNTDGSCNVSCLTGNAEVSGSSSTTNNFVPLVGGQSSGIGSESKTAAPPAPMSQQDKQDFSKAQDWVVKTALQQDINQEAQVAPAVAIVVEIPNAKPGEQQVQEKAPEPKAESQTQENKTAPPAGEKVETAVKTVIDALNASGIEIKTEVIENLKQQIQEIQTKVEAQTIQELQSQVNQVQTPSNTNTTTPNNINSNNNNNANSSSVNNNANSSADSSSSSSSSPAAMSYSQLGVYGPESTTVPLTVSNVFINAEGITLRNMNIIGNLTVNKKTAILQNITISGNLILGAGIEEGDVIMNNVVVKGNTVVNGGGGSSIHIIDSQLSTVTVDKENSTVRIVAEGNTGIGDLTLYSGASLQENGLSSGASGFSSIVAAAGIPAGAMINLSGSFASINIDAPDLNIGLGAGSIEQLNIAAAAAGTKFNLAAGARIQSLTANAAAVIGGAGKIDSALIKAAGVRMAQVPANLSCIPGVDAMVAGYTMNQNILSLGAIAGRVVDSLGQGLPGALVTARNGAAASSPVPAVADGIFMILGLSPGTYNLEASLPTGTYCSATVNNISVTAGHITIVQPDIQLDSSPTPPVTPAGNVKLTSLTLTDINGNPISIESFDPDRTRYNASVGSSIEQVMVTAQPQDPAAVVSVNGVVTPGNSHTLNILTGPHTISIEVNNGGIINTYTLSILRQSSASSDVAHLGFNNRDAVKKVMVEAGYPLPSDSGLQLEVRTEEGSTLDSSIGGEFYLDLSVPLNGSPGMHDLIPNGMPSVLDGETIFYRLVYSGGSGPWVADGSIARQRPSNSGIADGDFRVLAHKNAVKVFNDDCSYNGSRLQISTDDGATWSSSATLVSEAAGEYEVPCLSSGSVIRVAYIDAQGNYQEASDPYTVLASPTGDDYSGGDLANLSLCYNNSGGVNLHSIGLLSNTDAYVLTTIDDGMTWYKMLYSRTSGGIEQDPISASAYIESAAVKYAYMDSQGNTSPVSLTDGFIAGITQMGNGNSLSPGTCVDLPVAFSSSVDCLGISDLSSSLDITAGDPDATVTLSSNTMPSFGNSSNGTIKVNISGGTWNVNGTGQWHPGLALNAIVSCAGGHVLAVPASPITINVAPPDAPLLSVDTDYSTPVAGSLPGTTTINTLNLPSEATKWQFKIQSSALSSTPVLDSIPDSVTIDNYPAGNLITIPPGWHLILYATDNDDCIKRYADMVVNPSQIASVETRVACGNAHSLALRNDGTVIAWGDDTYHQCSNIPAELNGVVAVAAGYYYSMALKNDGTVEVWGDDSAHQCSGIPAGLNGVVAIAAGSAHSLALKSDGTVVGWGAYNCTYNPATIPSSLNGKNVMAIAAGGFHSLALTDAGAVVAWGAGAEDTGGDNRGQANVPGTASSGVTAIAGGAYQSFALKSDGTVVAWGCNDQGSTTLPSVITSAATAHVTAIAAGAWHGLALKDNGTVVAWGTNFSGPVPAGLSGVVSLGTGPGNHALAVRNDGTIVGWPLSNSAAQIPSTLLSEGTDYTALQPGANPGTTKVTGLTAAYTHWQFEVRSNGLGIPLQNNSVTGAADYTEGMDIPAVIGQHLLLLATDGSGNVQAYADILLTAAMGSKVFNQDGMGFSGTIVAQPLTGCAMTGYNSWPTTGGFSKGSNSFSGAVFDGQNIWMVPSVANQVIKLDKDSSPGDSMTGYTPPGITTYAFNGGVFDGQKIWLIPYNADRVVSFDKTTPDSMNEYGPAGVGVLSQWPDGFTKEAIAFIGGVFDGQNIWMVPYSADQVIKIDKDSGTMTGYGPGTGTGTWAEAGLTKGAEAFTGAVFDGQNIWLVPCKADRVIKINKDTGAMTGYTFTGLPTGFDKGAYGFFGGTFDGEYIWLAPRDANMVVKINKDTGAMTGYSAWPSGFNSATSSQNKFLGAIYDGQGIWLIPCSADRIIRIDQDGNMTGYSNWGDAGITKGNWYFQGGVFDGHNIWLIPQNADRAVKISSP